MKNCLIVLAAFFCITLAGCGGEPPAEPVVEQTDVTTDTAAESEATYELRGVIVARDPMANTVKIDHEAIGDWMGAMTMSFPVRGADVQSLPADGTAVTGTVHVDGTDFWVTDVAPSTPATPESDSAIEDPSTDTATD